MKNLIKHKHKFSSINFTLIEIVAVLAVIMILSGIVLANLRLPVFASLDKTTKSVRKIFSDAQMKTSLQGKEIQVVYDAEKKEFRITYPSADEEETVSEFETFNEESVQSNPRLTLRIPNDIEVEFPDYEEEIIQYRFFPDGSASGPEMNLTLKGRTMIVGVSRLTGLAYSREEEEE